VSDSSTTSQRAAGQHGATKVIAAPDVVSGERALAFGLGHPQQAAEAQLQDAHVHPALTAAPGLAFFEESPDAVLRFDADRRVVYANPALEKATAISRWEFVGHALTEVERFAESAPLERDDCTLDTQEARWFKFAFPHPMGRKLFDVRLQIDFGVAPADLHVTAVLRDITAPKSALRASRAADEFVETMLTSARIGICLLDRDQHIAWNDTARADLRHCRGCDRTLFGEVGLVESTGSRRSCSACATASAERRWKRTIGCRTTIVRGCGSRPRRCSSSTADSTVSSSRPSRSTANASPRVP
jgi:PAS domain-containing protein